MQVFVCFAGSGAVTIVRAGTAQHLASKGAVDAKRLCIDGGSAGGYTTLACLAFRRGRMRRHACMGLHLRARVSPAAWRNVRSWLLRGGLAGAHTSQAMRLQGLCVRLACSAMPTGNGGPGCLACGTARAPGLNVTEGSAADTYASAGMCSRQERVTTAWPTASCLRRYGLLPCPTLSWL